MAENKLKPQLDEFIAGNTNAETAGADFFKALANGQNALEGLSIKDLESLQSLINNLSDDNPLKEQINNRIASKMEQLSAQEVNVASDERDESQTDVQEQQPVTSDAPTQDDLKDLEFITKPSYSQFRRFEELHSAALRSELTDEQISTMEIIVNNAQKIVDVATNEEITPENAVSLKDYINILRDARTFDADEKEKIDALESKVDDQLKEFDKDNDLGKLKGVSAEELEEREKTLHQIADARLKVKYGDADLSDSEVEDYEIIKNLAIQEMKNSSIYPDEGLLKEVAEKVGATPKDIEDIFNKGKSGTPLTDAQQEVYNALRVEVIRDKAAEFDEKFEELKEQFEAAKAIERVKLSAEELYPEKEGMSPEELEQQRKKREKYIEEQITRDDGVPGREQWIKENALRALKGKHPNEEISDEELLKKYGKEFEELKQSYTIAADEIDEATKTSHVLKVEMLANRTARLTGAKGINTETQKFVSNYAANKKHKESFTAGKLALSIGKSIAISQSVRFAFGFKGMAVYSAYQTSKSVKKSWAKYKDTLQNGDKASFLGYCKYLKNNPKELTDVVSKVSKTAVMSSLAVVGTALGIDNIPGLSAAIVGGINVATAATKIHQNKEEIKSAWQNRGQYKQMIKDKLPNALKKHKWALGIVAGVATAGFVAYTYFASDETKEKINDALNDMLSKAGDAKDKVVETLGEAKEKVGDTLGNLVGDNTEGLTALDEKLVAESGGAGHTDVEGEDILKNVPKNNGGIDDPLGLKAQENAEAPTSPEGNASGDATTPAVALDENDISLLKADCKMGPDPIVAKLEEMKILSDEDKAKLIGCGGREGGVTSRVLAAYLGHPYDNTEVPIHANLTLEQQQELNQFLHSEEYQHQCDRCNAEDNARRIAKLRGKVSKDNLGVGGNSNGDSNANIVNNANGNNFKFEKVNGDNINTTPVQTKYSYEVSQRKKAIFNIVNKSLNAENTEVDLSKYYTQEQLAQMRPEDIEKASMQAAAYQYIQDHGVKRAEIVDSKGNVHTYYREDLKKDGDMITKRVDRDADGHKVTTKVTGSSNGATKVDYKGKIEQVTFTDEQGNEVNVGGEGADKIKKVIVDPTTGKEYTLVKGDDGKSYTLEKDLSTGKTTVGEGMSKRQMNKIYEAAKQSQR